MNRPFAFLNFAAQALFWGGIVAAGCSSGPRAPVVVSVQPRMTTPNAVRAETWNFQEAARAPSELENTLAQHYQREMVLGQPSNEYMCVAREVAAHLAAFNGARADETLQRWFAGRCHAPDLFYWISSVNLLSDGTALDPPARPDILAPVVDRLQVPKANATEFGVGAHAAGPNAYIVLATAAPDGSVKAQGPDANGVVRIDGRSRNKLTSVRAVINQNATAIADCKPDSSIRLPEFRFSCPMATDDQEAWIDVLGTEPITNWERPIAQTLATRSNSLPYRRAKPRIASNGNATGSLLMSINDLRRRAGLSPIRLAEEQTRAAQAGFPAAFRAVANNDYYAEDRWKSELLVGEGIAEAIQWGRVFLTIAYGGGRADWLAAVLARPLTREVVMNPNIELVTITTNQDNSVGFGASFAGYSLFHKEDHPKAAAAIYERIRQARAAKSLSTTPHAIPRAFEELANEVMAGREPDEVFRELMTQVNAHSRPPARGLTFELNGTDTLSLPSVLLQPGSLTCAVIVSHRKRPNINWGKWVIFIVFWSGADGGTGEKSDDLHADLVSAPEKLRKATSRDPMERLPSGPIGAGPCVLGMKRARM